MPLSHTSQTNNIYIPGLGRAEGPPAESLPGSRDRVIRGYTDEDVGHLPELPETHPQHSIWRHRKRSCRRLVEYLAFKNKTLSILDVGCGNGWLSFQLSSIPGNRVL